MLAQRHGHPAEMLARGSIHVHIATNKHAELVRGSHATKGRGKGLLAARDSLGVSGLAQPHLGAEIGSPEADDVVAETGGDSCSGVAHHRVAGPATVGNRLPMT